MATQQIIQDSILKGLSWIVGQQFNDGHWAQSVVTPSGQTTLTISTTGLAVLKLETYALEQGFETPFDDEYIYRENVIKGLNYLFGNALQLPNGNVYFRDEDGNVNGTTGIVLAAISASSSPDKLVTVIGSVVNGNTYKYVVDNITDYLKTAQQGSGGWAIEKTAGSEQHADNSDTGYVILGLKFATSPTYKFESDVDQGVISKLSKWIDSIQNANGGAALIPGGATSILQTGFLITEMHFVGDDLSSTRLSNALTYIADAWNNNIANGGWKTVDNSVTPPVTTISYETTFTTMEGLTDYEISTLTSTGGTTINWFTDMSNALIALQNPAGYWMGDTVADLLSTIFAVLTLERSPQSPAYIPYENNIRIEKKEKKCPWDLSKTIQINGEIKIFAKKFSHSESDCIPGTKPSKGDDIGFTLVFGNYGEFTYEAKKGIPTIEDTLYVESPANLKLMSLCLCDNYKLFYDNTNIEVKPCDIFYGSIGTYVLQIRKLVNGKYVKDFDLPCHSIGCISMLFQIDFPSCPKCPDDEPLG